MSKPQMRTKSHELPLIRYTKKNDRSVRRWRHKQTAPITITKRNLRQVIEEIGKEDDSKSKHRLIAQYGSGAESALTTCVMPSLELLTYNPSAILVHSASTLLHQLRKSLLNHEWNFSCQLLQILIQSKLINKRLLIHVIRVSLMILLNHCKHPEILEEFLTLTLGLNDETRMNQFLTSIFKLPKEIKTTNHTKF